MRYYIIYFLSVFLAFGQSAKADSIDLKNAPELTISQNSNPLYAKIALGTTIGASNNSNATILTSIGIGYQFNDLLRLDTNLEYRNKNTISARDSFDYKANINTFDFMANAYLDLATIRDITPYIGVGLGVANHSVDMNSLIVNTYNVQNNNWDLAWALHAGVALQIAPQVSLDLGYSYTNLGKSPNMQALNNQIITFDNITSHDIKIALRFQFN